ncbi:hypothetical protein [Treponema socranskii]|uniref:hypothetical protein n=1 Tax=Treponema socranskii TaxID=53419 RepID=UPI0023EF6F9D|nr:hypothetical protein [Treponema socranskii]
MRNFKRIVSNNIERKKFLYHRDNLIFVIIIVIKGMLNTENTKKGILTSLRIKLSGKYFIFLKPTVSVRLASGN